MKFVDLKLSPLAAFDKMLESDNPTAATAAYTVTNITDLGATANPNTSAMLNGDGISAFGSVSVTFNRLNVKNSFSKFGDVIRRPAIDIRSVGNITAGQKITLSTISTAIEKSLGLNLRTGGDYPDADGAQTVTAPALGGYVDMDVVINKANSLRFRPSSVDKLPIRLRYSGVVWPAAMSSDDIRVRVPNPINDADHRLITYIPFGETLDAAFAGDYVNLPFNAAAGYALSGDVGANSSGIALSASELSVSDELLLMPLNQTVIDLVTGTSASSASGTPYYGSPGMRGDIGLKSTNYSAIIPNVGNVRSAFTGTKQWSIEFEAIIPTMGSGLYQQILTSQRSGGWDGTATIGVFASSGGLVALSMRTSSSAGVTVGSLGWNDGKCHTFAFTRTATGLLAFVDGVLVATKPTVASVQSGTAPLRIMSLSDNSDGWFQGKLRNLRIWDFAKITEGYTPFRFYENAEAKINLVSMVGREYAITNWTEVVKLIANTSEPAGTAIRWLIAANGKYYKYVLGSGLVEIPLADIMQSGHTTVDLVNTISAAGGNPFGSKLALVARLITTDPNLTPSITNIDIAARIPFSAYAGAVVSYPTPAQAVGGLRDDKGTRFNGNGINIGSNGLNASGEKLGDIFGRYNDWTVEFDVARVSHNSRQTILWQRASSSSTAMSIYIGFTADNKIEFGYYPDAGLSWVGTATTVTIADTVPHHIEVNRSGGVIRCFIDGKLAGSFAATSSNNAVPTSPYFIGRQATSETSWQGPLYAYLRDFCIYNYARHTSDYVVEPHVIISDDLSLNNSEMHPRQGRTCASALLYNVDFGPAIDSVGLSNIIAQSTSTALGGDVIVALNATLAANGIPITLPETVELNDMVVTNIRNVVPNAAIGQNVSMNNVFVIKTDGIIHDNTITMGSTLAFHMH